MTLLVSKKRKNGSLLPTLTTELLNTDLLFPDVFNLNERLLNWNKFIQFPSVNIKENDKAYQIELAAPGLQKEDFKIEIENDILLISTEKEEEEESEEKKDYTRKEFSYNYFSRSFRLPENLLSDQIEAKYENGLLKLTLPKSEITLTKPKKEIKVS